LNDNPKAVGFITKFHIEGPYLAPLPSTTAHFLNIVAGLYSSLKKGQVLCFSPLNLKVE
jgi:hypothetical protein